MARKFANYIQNRRIEPVLKPTLRADSLGTDSSVQAARVGSKIEPKFGSGANSESLHLELSPSLGEKDDKVNNDSLQIIIYNKISKKFQLYMMVFPFIIYYH